MHRILPNIAAALSSLAATFIIQPSASAQMPQRVALPASPQTCASSSSLPTYAYTYESVEESPSFPGGDGAMMRFINSERKYPREAYEASIEGRVLCSFVVEADGSLSNIAVLRGVEESLNAEAVRVISAMPAWEPGKIHGENVAVYCLLPIPFRR